MAEQQSETTALYQWILGTNLNVAGRIEKLENNQFLANLKKLLIIWNRTKS